jgi:hypothetical protein
MTSEAQVSANRLNAMKSTGPRTRAGKAVVGLNNMKHGILSREVLVQGESEADLVGFGKRLRAQLAPVGELELLLADRIVSNAWRLRRAAGIEAALLNTKRGDKTVLEDVLSWTSDRDRLQLISRYETTLERSLYKALHELQRLQAARAGQPVPLPEAIDVEVLVSGPDEADEMALIGENRPLQSEATRAGARN